MPYWPSLIQSFGVVSLAVLNTARDSSSRSFGHSSGPTDDDRTARMRHHPNGREPDCGSVLAGWGEVDGRGLDGSGDCAA